jgi:GT2 family glycosyltransferase
LSSAPDAPPPTGPTVSIAVLNYQRCDALRRALHAARRQRGALEILAVDNASTDGSVEMVRREFPDVRVVALSENLGTAGRNAGVRAARGDVVVTLDNDVLLEGDDALPRVLAVLDRHPRAAVVDFTVLGPEGDLSRRDWCHPRDPDLWAGVEFTTCVVLEGASACRRSEFLALGGYWPPFFIGHEGWDLGLRLIAAGRDVVYSPAIRARHLVESSARPSERIYYTFVRNAIWVAARNHRGGRALASVSQDLALVGFCAARAGHLRAWARGVRDAVQGLPQALASRAPLDRAARARLDAVCRHRPRLASRIRRHLRQRLI